MLRIAPVRLALVGAFFLLVTAPASAANITGVVTFGDSLVDSGNTQNLLGGPGAPSDPAPAGFGYFDGRFSNGPVYSDLVHDYFVGGNHTESTLGGSNYAFGGARAEDNSPTDPVPDLAAQVSAFLADTGGIADVNNLYLINAGGNDVRDILLGEPGADIAGAVAEIVGAVSVLSAAGASQILVAGVGNVGGIPETIALGPTAEAAGRSVSEAFNAALFPALAGLSLPNLHTLDVIALFDAVLADPGDYGLPLAINITDACLTAGAPPPGGAPTCEDFAFFDTIHPTDAVHEILAGAAIAAVPEPGTASLIAFGLVALARRRR